MLSHASFSCTFSHQHVTALAGTMLICPFHLVRMVSCMRACRAAHDCKHYRAGVGSSQENRKMEQSVDRNRQYISTGRLKCMRVSSQQIIWTPSCAQQTTTHLGQELARTSHPTNLVFVVFTIARNSLYDKKRALMIRTEHRLAPEIKFLPDLVVSVRNDVPGHLSQAC